MGLIDDINIDEFNFYSDGIIVKSSAETKEILKSIEFFKKWLADNTGLDYLTHFDVNKTFESTILFQCDADLFKPLNAYVGFAEEIKSKLKSSTSAETNFKATGFQFFEEPKKIGQMPLALKIERPFDSEFKFNFYIAYAPIPSEDLWKSVQNLVKSLTTAS